MYAYPALHKIGTDLAGQAATPETLRPFTEKGLRAPLTYPLLDGDILSCYTSLSSPKRGYPEDYNACSGM